MTQRLLIAILRARAASLPRRRFEHSRIREVAIVELTQLGDVLVILPALKVLSDIFPGARVHIFLNSKYRGLLENVYSEVPVELHPIENPEQPSSFVRAIREIRTLHGCLAISMSPPKRNALLVLASAAAAKVGYLTYRDTITPYLQSTPVEGFGCTLHSQESYGFESINERPLKIVRALGAHDAGRHHAPLFGDTALARAAENLHRQRLLPDRHYVAIHPFSRWKYRTWKLARFGSLASLIHTRLQYNVVFVSSADEAAYMEPLRQRFSGNSEISFFTSNNLVETAAIFRRAHAVVCNDSGPMHLAAGVGARVVGLFGPSSPELTAPANGGGTFLYEKVECSPCDQLACIRPHEPCIDLLSVEDVFAGVSAAVERSTGIDAEAHA